MATLTIPFTFVAGTAAKAAEVNANFDAVESWSQGNIGTDNLGVLYSRSVPLPISPSNAILNISQSSNNQSIYISNSGTVSPLQIAQSGQLATTNAILKIDSTGLSQTVAGAAEILVNSHVNSTIPALLINHGATETLRLTKTALNVGTNVTTTLGGPLVLSNPSVTGSINLAGNLTVTGKETINRTSTNQFLELANTTTSKSLTVTPETSSFDLNINDVASAYQFQINGVTKAKIDNNGLDGSYLKTGSVPTAALTTTGLFTDTIVNQTYSRSSGTYGIQPTNGSVVTTLYSNSISDLVSGKPILISIAPNTYDNAYIQTSVIFDTNDPGRAPGGDDSSINFYSAIRIKINGNIVGIINSAFGAFNATNSSTTDNYQTQTNTIYGGYSAMVLSPITGTGTILIEMETNIIAAVGHAIATMSGGFYSNHVIIIAPIR